jgi:nicotinamide-nucleotide amidase
LPDDLGILARSAELIANYRRAGLKLATAESCTGGLIASTLTEIAGSSDVVDRGFVTYSNEAKSEMLGVPPDLIGRVGAVSAEVAMAMAEGAVRHSRADVAVSVTGIAGPTGATATKPVGLVHLGVCRRGGEPRQVEKRFQGDRASVRRQALSAAFDLLARETD